MTVAMASALSWEVFLGGLRRGEPWAYLFVGLMVLVAFMACHTWATPGPVATAPRQLAAGAEGRVGFGEQER